MENPSHLHTGTATPDPCPHSTPAANTHDKLIHTCVRPTLLQMDTALVENAVAKAARGPTSTTVVVGPGAGSWLPGVSSCGSNVSRSSLGHKGCGGGDSCCTENCRVQRGTGWPGVQQLRSQGFA